MALIFKLLSCAIKIDILLKKNYLKKLSNFFKSNIVSLMKH